MKTFQRGVKIVTYGLRFVFIFLFFLKNSFFPKRHYLHKKMNGPLGGHLPFPKLTWLVLGEDQAARSHRVEQLTAL